VSNELWEIRKYSWSGYNLCTGNISCSDTGKQQGISVKMHFLQAEILTVDLCNRMQARCSVLIVDQRNKYRSSGRSPTMELVAWLLSCNGQNTNLHVLTRRNQRNPWPVYACAAPQSISKTYPVRWSLLQNRDSLSQWFVNPITCIPLLTDVPAREPRVR
jgi:hypothetical protein